jgi:hypothetical protein
MLANVFRSISLFQVGGRLLLVWQLESLGTTHWPLIFTKQSSFEEFTWPFVVSLDALGNSWRLSILLNCSQCSDWLGFSQRLELRYALTVLQAFWLALVLHLFSFFYFPSLPHLVLHRLLNNDNRLHLLLQHERRYCLLFFKQCILVRNSQWNWRNPGLGDATAILALVLILRFTPAWW